MLLTNLQLFLTIAEKGSLVAAARETGLSTTTVSERLAALEAHYAVVLFNRTTRSLSLTEEGRLLTQRAKSLLSDVADLDALIRHGAQTLSGPIRISSPVDLGHGLLSDALLSFAQQHPDISIEQHLSDGYVDLVGGGFDLAIRLGTVPDSSLRVRTLRQVQRRVCAAPAYLQTKGIPQRPEDLAQHNCLIMRFGDMLDNAWDFVTGTKRTKIIVHGKHIANDGRLIRAWALAGCGIVLKSELDVAEDIRSGALVPLLQDHLPPPVPLQMMFPPGRAQPRRVTALADHILRALPAADLCMTSE